MKSFLTLGLALASLTFIAAGCSDKKSTAETTTTAPATGIPMAADSAGTSPMAPATTAITYTCPMHPEVVSDKPGKCPKCGMALVKK